MTKVQYLARLKRVESSNSRLFYKFTVLSVLVPLLAGCELTVYRSGRQVTPPRRVSAARPAGTTYVVE